MVVVLFNLDSLLKPIHSSEDVLVKAFFFVGKVSAFLTLSIYMGYVSAIHKKEDFPVGLKPLSSFFLL